MEMSGTRSGLASAGSAGDGDDVIPDDVEVVRADEDTSFVPIDELDVSPRPDQRCDHVYRIDGRRVFALEPDPHTGYWTACPSCGLLLGQRNLGEIPAELRTL